LDGAVRWVAELPGAVPADVVVAEDPPRYVGPIVAGGKVMVISKSGQLHVFNPDTGVEIEKKSLGMTVLTAPQVAAGRLFVMGNGGTLNAYE
jgi:outer membrane protein assembly factor BamB